MHFVCVHKLEIQYVNLFLRKVGLSFPGDFSYLHLNCPLTPGTSSKEYSAAILRLKVDRMWRKNSVKRWLKYGVFYLTVN